jgi:ribosomal protein S18 acetylase RimI-like enzyme
VGLYVSVFNAAPWQRLLRELQNRLANEGFERIYLQTGRTAPARIFYESTGFRDLGLVSLGKRVEVG